MLFSALLIVFREVLEAGLVISVVVAACAGIRIRHLVFIGIAAGVLFSCVLALFTNTIENMLSGMGQEVFNAVLLLVAAIMLAWQISWMSVKGKQIADENRREVQLILDKRKNKNYAIAVVVAIAVMREGSEVVLILYGQFASVANSGASMVSGGVLGVIAGILVSWALYRGFILIPLKWIFRGSNIVLTLIAAGLASQGVSILASIDLLPDMGYQVWDTSSFLSDNSDIAAVARAIFGYTATPSGVQLVTWLIVVVAISLHSARLRAKRKPKGDIT